MKTVQGFVSRADQLDNTPGEVSKVFELSTYSRTYSKEIGIYQNAISPESTLQTFKTADESGQPYVLESTQVSEIFEVVQEAINYVTSKFPPFNQVDFISTLQAAFYGKIKDLNSGTFLIGEKIQIPEWLSWTSVTHPDVEVKVWLADAALQEQYDKYDIVVIPPVDDLDRFFGNYAQMKATLDDITFPMLIENIQEEISKNPSSAQRGYLFNYVNPANPTQKTPAPFAVIVYGKAGDNIDTIKDALVEYILTHSTKGQSDWEVIFPEIFTRTEFYLIPLWNKVAIKNLTIQGDIYSSFLSPVECMTFTRQFLNNISPAHIDSNTHIIPFEYRSVTVMTVNGVKNIEGKTNIHELFPDYIPVNTASPDFNRMSEYTKKWIQMVTKLLQTAEKATIYSTIENPMRRIKRNGKYYISMVYDNVNYLVAAKTINGDYQ